MTVVAQQPLPTWWPEDAVRCYTDLCEYRLVGASACADRITGAISAVAGAASERLDLAGDLAQALAEAGQLFRALKPDTSLYANSLDLLLRGEPTAPAVAERAEALTAYRRRSQERIAVVAAATLREAESILVHDYSSAVLRTLAECARDRPRRVIVTECALLGQGPRVAEAAADMGHRVVYGSDCSIGRLTARADAFVTGVEGFFADGSFANTVGTLPIAFLCREFGVPVVAPAELLKLDRLAETACVDSLHARLLHPWPTDPQLGEHAFEIEDHVLDAVAADLVTCYATEHGRARPGEIGTLAVQAMRSLSEALTAARGR